MAMTNETADFQDFEEAAEHLRQADLKTWQLYNTVSNATGLEAYDEYREAVAEAVAKIQAKTGPLYTEEGKAAQIREDIEQLAGQYISKGKKRVEKRAAALAELKGKLSDDIARGSRIKQPDELEQLQAETRTALAFASTGRNVETILRELVERGTRDKTAAQFAATYGYLFADRAAELADGPDKAASLSHISSLLAQAKSQAYSDTVRAKLTIQKAVEWKQFFSSPSTRLIEMYRDGQLKKYR